MAGGASFGAHSLRAPHRVAGKTNSVGRYNAEFMNALACFHRTLPTPSVGSLAALRSRITTTTKKD
ncbi:hypothetical protein C6570_13160 [Ottowia oryzae]|uniref:Uncharacterized protein n=1 Tax=Ottowia oryzae TaxID=2109914 RepID=A0A2S0MGW8_9BURK|nr:hypothetical protein C6570_13160 [Ottowia oryzae]